MKSKIILLFLFLSLSAFSQQKDLSGIVVDSETSIPLQNANIYLTKNKTGTTSDRQGKFVLKEVSESDTLIISYLGYKQLSLPVSQLQNNQTFFLEG